MWQLSDFCHISHIHHIFFRHDIHVWSLSCYVAFTDWILIGILWHQAWHEAYGKKITNLFVTFQKKIQFCSSNGKEWKSRWMEVFTIYMLNSCKGELWKPPFTELNTETIFFEFLFSEKFVICITSLVRCVVCNDFLFITQITIKKLFEFVGVRRYGYINQ